MSRRAISSSRNATDDPAIEPILPIVRRCLGHVDRYFDVSAHIGDGGPRDTKRGKVLAPAKARGDARDSRADLRAQAIGERNRP
jgi:hypothetical protein